MLEYRFMSSLFSRCDASSIGADSYRAGCGPSWLSVLVPGGFGIDREGSLAFEVSSTAIRASSPAPMRNGRIRFNNGDDTIKNQYDNRVYPLQGEETLADVTCLHHA
jgi:hypothetical protein